VLKPWPISWLDKKIHGGLGIMLDDVLAGIFSWLGVFLFYYFMAQ
jgi:phosphatidylglycerophosphatase A